MPDGRNGGNSGAGSAGGASGGTGGSRRTPFQEEQARTEAEIIEYKKSCEANIAGSVYKRPELIYGLDIDPAEFSNKAWRIYYRIACGVLVEEGKKDLGNVTVGLYLKKFPKLQAAYMDCGGYRTIYRAMEYIDEGNLDSYAAEFRKWNVVLEMNRAGFPVADRLADFKRMSAEDIYDQYEAGLNDMFARAGSGMRTCGLCDGIGEMKEALKAGSAVGLPYYGMPMLSRETGGQYLGSITLLGGISNAGKSTLARSLVLPSAIEANEKVVAIINEDSVAKWQREMLVWVCNNKLGYDIDKRTVRDGAYTPEQDAALDEAIRWLEGHAGGHAVTMVPFQTYQTSKAVKVVRKYAAMGVKYFILDTFKADAGRAGSNTWLEMQQAMVGIKDAVKAEALNVHILITFQLEKGSSTMRYYTQNNIGLAKNIVDVASTCLMVRDLFPDEYTDGRNAVKTYRYEGKSKVEVRLDEGRRYQAFFIVKNQEGASNFRQIIAEHDKSRNVIREVGVANISPSGF